MAFSSFSATAALNCWDSDSDPDEDCEEEKAVITSVWKLDRAEASQGVKKNKNKKKQRSAKKRTLDIHGSRNTRRPASQKKVFLADVDGRPINRKSDDVFTNDDFFSPAKEQEKVKTSDDTNRIRGWFSSGKLDPHRREHLHVLIQTLNSLPACTNMIHGAKDRLWFKQNRCLLTLARSVREREFLREAFSTAALSTAPDRLRVASALIITTWKGMRGSEPSDTDLRWAECVFERWVSEETALANTERCAQEIFGDKNKKVGGCWGDSDSDDEERDVSCLF